MQYLSYLLLILVVFGDVHGTKDLKRGKFSGVMKEIYKMAKQKIVEEIHESTGRELEKQKKKDQPDVDIQELNEDLDDEAEARAKIAFPSGNQGALTEALPFWRIGN